MKPKLFRKIAVVMMMTAAVVMTARPYDSGDNDLAPDMEAGVTVSSATLELYVGDKQTLTAEVTLADVADKTLTWSSSNTDVATVDPATGEVTAVATGTAIITATAANDKTGSCTITVSPDVYVAGYADSNNSIQIAALWKNGVWHALTNGTNAAYAKSVYVSGNDVYVAGEDDNKPVLWKNGVVQVLPHIKWGSAYSVYVSGSDVYIAGENSYIPALWKNGVKQALNAGYGSAKSVYVSGSDVYVAGEDNYKPVLWKNGVKQILSNDGGVAQSVFISGTDIYVVGDDDSGAVLWKNGVKQALPSTSWASAHSVYVSGTDVYVAGRDDSGAVLWKNGVQQALYGVSARSVFVSGSDVYVAGENSNKPVLWKNG
ncbi:MAG: Ig-like domain-containing protein, partial [Flavobacteriaceae bacterium]|nr:Ig-like domain-containing protein [Flavobacteriaceae bacterium]